MNEPEIFRMHSVDQETLRRVSEGILHPKISDNHLHAVCSGCRSPFAIEQVPVSQAVEVMPEINSGENDPVAVVNSLAPEMFMGREVHRCRHCHLRQFVTVNGNCRKCRQSMAPEAIPDVQPVILPIPESGVFPGRATRPPVMDADFDIGFAVKLLRLANGMSQRDLASRGAWPRSYVSKLENNRLIPTLESLGKLAIALDTDNFSLVTIAEAGCAA